MSGNMCGTDAVYCGSESQIRITSSRLGAGVDILTMTVSDEGLGARWKVPTAVQKV